ncbi:hypothetical protein [Arcobacter sp. LA11]|uniref:hypothetical protein n=1 Tax=Arcobacter sp. LA11 TaxID=1898176 RepID=UPI0009350544|nr:hypothetical protein [Arcobacter sp. LA11]
MKKNILIRCDASEKIGLGHITRCLVLAKNLEKMGYKIYFATKNYELGIKKIKESKYNILIPSEENFNYDSWIQNITDNKNINIFIGDVRDNFPIKTIKKLKEKKILTIAIDEPSEYAKECDLCFYPPHATINEKDYSGKVYKGFEYVILRDEFYQDCKKQKNDIPNVLVMMGGTDPYHLTFEVVEELISIEQNINISVIIKENHPDRKRIKNLGKNINIYFDVKNMASFLTKIDFAVISFGVSAYELLAMDIPAIHICLDEEHYKASCKMNSDKINLILRKDEINIKKLNFDFKVKKLFPKCLVTEVISTYKI